MSFCRVGTLSGLFINLELGCRIRNPPSGGDRLRPRLQPRNLIRHPPVPKCCDERSSAPRLQPGNRPAIPREPIAPWPVPDVLVAAAALGAQLPGSFGRDAQLHAPAHRLGQTPQGRRSDSSTLHRIRGRYIPSRLPGNRTAPKTPRPYRQPELIISRNSTSLVVLYWAPIDGKICLQVFCVSSNTKEMNCTSGSSPALRAGSVWVTVVSPAPSGTNSISVKKLRLRPSSTTRG